MPTKLRLTMGLSRLARPRTAEVGIPGGIVSFSFDDFPLSALAQGGAVLERLGARGTYYTCMKLMVKGEPGMPAASDVRAAHERGHEIACHTYSHLDCGRAPAGQVMHDVAANAAALDALIPGFAPRSFAYPFGNVALGAKRALARHFASCRGVRSGINRGRADLGELRANRIYSRLFDYDGLRRLVDEARASGGWLILYTHDVGDPPTDIGCRPAELEMVAAHAVAGGTVLPVGPALDAVLAAA